METARVTSQRVKAAYQIPLPVEDLVLLGELCVIQGQIEWTMQNTVRELLSVERETMLSILGSSSVAANAGIWRKVVAEKLADDEAQTLADIVVREVALIAAGRNDFVHAVYGHANPDFTDGYAFRVDLAEVEHKQDWVAIRVRNRAVASRMPLGETRDRAALISVLVGEIGERSKGSVSPWLDRLPEVLVSLKSFAAR